MFAGKKDVFVDVVEDMILIVDNFLTKAKDCFSTVLFS